MYNGLLHLHNFNRWLIVLFAVITIVSMLRGFSAGAVLGKGARRNALILLILCDVQLLVGLYQYFFGDFGWNVIKNGGDVMKNPVARFWGVEHISGMIAAILLVHIGYAGLKRAVPDSAKMKKMFWCTVFAVVLIVASVPWPGRGPGIERPLMPGGKTMSINITPTQPLSL